MISCIVVDQIFNDVPVIMVNGVIVVNDNDGN